MTTRIDISSTLLADGIAVTPSDTTVYNPPLTGLYVGVSGDVTVVGRSGVPVLYKAYPQGSYILMNIIKVMATGTNATNLVGGVPI